MSRIIGIDLGTTNSLAAVWQDGESKLIPNAFGEYLTPSVVSIGEDGTVYVGKTAKERLASYPDRTASVFKRFMGTSRKYTLGEKSYRPEELSAFVLKKLKEDAERYLEEPVEEAIISVPAYFNDMARNATKRAGMIAGLKVERIINEPSAAALACQNLNQEEDAMLLVFDFGGGTLDVSLVECFDNIIEIKAVSGDNQLGGQDFDDMIAGHFAKSLNLNYAEMKPETKAIIRKSAELCKRELTEKTAANMVVNCQEINNEIKITRKDVVKLCAPLFERIGKPVSRVFVDAQIASDQVGQVVLVGGSCKMPVVQQYLSYLLKREDIVTKEPDYMIALGCGVCAGIKERDKDIKDLLLTDICPFSLGVDVINEQDIYKPLMSFIIERNSPLPVSKENMYVNALDKQSRIRLKIYQGEAMYATENLFLGEISFDIPMMAAGQVQCFVRFTYDINGVLEVEAKIPLTKEEKKLVIVNKDLDMTQEEIEEKLKEFEKVKRPFADERNTYILEWGQRLFMQCSQEEMRNEILRRIQYFQHTISFDEYHLPKARKYLTVYFAYIEGLLNSYVGFADDALKDGAWYQEEDEEEREMETLFREWEEEKEDSGDNDER
ncbi:MAG: molecular chaperone HscC [Lachnospiraceae bacterium]|nr:molecular chaperone HscC [Lachnospiraceae bacterium]